MNNRLLSTTILHDTLHSFRQERGTETVTMEENIEKKLTGIVNETLLQVFIDVQKCYDSLDRGICMEIIRGYGLGPKLHRILQRY